LENKIKNASKYSYLHIVRTKHFNRKVFIGNTGINASVHGSLEIIVRNMSLTITVDSDNILILFTKDNGIPWMSQYSARWWFSGLIDGCRGPWKGNKTSTLPAASQRQWPVLQQTGISNFDMATIAGTAEDADDILWEPHASHLY